MQLHACSNALSGGHDKLYVDSKSAHSAYAPAGSLANLPLVLVPAIVQQSSVFGAGDADKGIAYVFITLLSSGIAAFSMGGYLLRRPKGPVDTSVRAAAEPEQTPPDGASPPDDVALSSSVAVQLAALPRGSVPLGDDTTSMSDLRSRTGASPEPLVATPHRKPSAEVIAPGLAPSDGMSWPQGAVENPLFGAPQLLLPGNIQTTKEQANDVPPREGWLSAGSPPPQVVTQLVEELAALHGLQDVVLPAHFHDPTSIMSNAIPPQRRVQSCSIDNVLAPRPDVDMLHRLAAYRATMHAAPNPRQSREVDRAAAHARRSERMQEMTPFLSQNGAGAFEPSQHCQQQVVWQTPAVAQVFGTTQQYGSVALTVESEAASPPFQEDAHSHKGLSRRASAAMAAGTNTLPQAIPAQPSSCAHASVSANGNMLPPLPPRRSRPGHASLSAGANLLPESPQSDAYTYGTRFVQQDASSDQRAERRQSRSLVGLSPLAEMPQAAPPRASLRRKAHRCWSRAAASWRACKRRLQSVQARIGAHLPAGIRERVWPVLRAALFNAPVLTIFLALFVALVTPIHDLFFAPAQDGSASSAADTKAKQPPLDVIAQALSRLGSAMIPALMVALGGSLSKGPGAKVPWRAIVSLCLLRLIVLPVLGFLCVLGLKAVGAFTSPSKVFMLVLLVQHSMPSALNVYAMAAVGGCCPNEVATMLFWQYVASVVTIPACVAVILSIV